MYESRDLSGDSIAIDKNATQVANARALPQRVHKIGLIVNPVAGMGGRVGLKGTDGAEVLAEARRRGAQPLSGARALSALKRLATSSASITLFTGAGELGEDVAKAAGFNPVVIHQPQDGASAPTDTLAAASKMVRESVELVLFAGGDGTARDVLGSVGDRIPILGIPTGVKMYSAVFGTTPENVGTLTARFIAGDPAVRVRDAEVMDIDENAIRQDQVSAQLYGYARSPYLRYLAQNAKAGSMPNEQAALEAVSRQIANKMRPGCLYIVGPGTTTRHVMSALGLPSTLLGVDAVLDGKLVGSDLNENALLQLMEGRQTYLIVGVLGGHGSLFGRGNQQISAEVIRRVGRNRIIVLATMEKLLSLATRRLHVDTGDEEVNTMLTGYLPVQTAPDRSIYYKVQA
ncbi:ATP-NAD kinase family protein [Noviherbaspirillum sp. CPCC 100848]|uniref:ATP-NAD kinase family protein n=1 Tax=Noviherbaspirillum album TaxID=3080276 RepID=A0ABU6JGR5_9BURK|nr:ATP-NAD kinase family protein [Noviherbaspirillum sp. CPCC 100848]MEC4722715.1 ATP-NAD kinase family protein [Noviherbaspirillum sp. CPCC 100848]